jgi:hypothetical protein
MTQPTQEKSQALLEEPENNSPSLLTTFILLVLILTMLASLIWPLLQRSLMPDQPRPTPTSPFLQEA